MKFILVLLFCIILYTDTLAKKQKLRDEIEKENVDDDKKDELDLIADDEAEEKEQKNEVIDEEEELKTPKDPCAGHYCGAGRICALNDQDEPICDCVPQCPVETDERRKVCSNHNETWSSDCEVYRVRCLCNKDREECLKKKYNHVHVNYYGICREIPDCTKEEMGDFPRRMREWLFAVMQELARRNELDKYYMKLEEEAEQDLSLKWVNAIVWKFCDLDAHPEDRAVSRHELFPIRAPLLAMEHCIAPFLDSCDLDSDHIITLVEWGTCLGLKEDEIEDKCKSVRKKQEEKGK
ncbi:SPARC-like isoform X2 [Limulus polyphemus]|uniref:SPARC-like isoform X2 n=1 Tax=Limulus polyphemus TaxID=6850 RepID=A0ABM1BUN1_LIMPO|nr:SPARC-like isoform X2 [Limulus polyphemus]